MAYHRLGQSPASAPKLSPPPATVAFSPPHAPASPRFMDKDLFKASCSGERVCSCRKHYPFDRRPAALARSFDQMLTITAAEAGEEASERCAVCCRARVEGLLWFALLGARHPSRALQSGLRAVLLLRHALAHGCKALTSLSSPPSNFPPAGCLCRHGCRRLAQWRPRASRPARRPAPRRYRRCGLSRRHPSQRHPRRARRRPPPALGSPPQPTRQRPAPTTPRSARRAFPTRRGSPPRPESSPWPPAPAARST